MKRFSISLILLFISFMCSCSKTYTLKPPELKNIYKDAAKQSDFHRNPVIVIPGILGSKLYDYEAEKEIWGAFNGQFEGPVSPEAARQVALPMKLGEPLFNLKDKVSSVGALDRLKIKLLGVSIAPKAYAQILATLGAGGYRDEELARSGAIDYGDDHFTCFQFHYDWRRSCSENAAELDAFIQRKKSFVKKQFKERYGVDKNDIKFDIVAHSMGGLVARYYLRYGNKPLGDQGALPKLDWSGARNVENCILVGTPNSGSVSAFEELVRGKSFAPKWLKYIPATSVPSYPAGVMGTYPSVYQLMPRVRHRSFIDHAGKEVNIYNPDLWMTYQWGLMNPDEKKMLKWLLPDYTEQERKKIIYEHLSKCLRSAERFHEALDKKSKKPRGVSITTIAGDAFYTKERFRVDLRDGSFSADYYAAGDGTVLRSSVLADERIGSEYSPGLDSPISIDRALFLPRNHINLTNDVTFSNNLLHTLLEE